MNNDEHLGTLITEINNKHLSAFYSWIRLIISLSSGILTLLIGLHKFYLPENPEFIIILKLSWVFLFFTISVGVVALYGESRVSFDLMNNLIKYRNLPQNHKNNKSIGADVPQFIRFSQIIFPYLFCFSLFSLLIFVIINI